MRRIIAAAATFVVASTLLAGATYADVKQRQGRAARTVRIKPEKPTKVTLSQTDGDLDLPQLVLPVKHYGGY